MNILRKRWGVTIISMVAFSFGWIGYTVFLCKTNGYHYPPLSDFLLMGLFGLVQGPLYLLPTIVGLHKRNALAIFILNAASVFSGMFFYSWGMLFLGWPGIGWVAALIWAVLKTGDSQETK